VSVGALPSPAIEVLTGAYEHAAAVTMKLKVPYFVCKAESSTTGVAHQARDRDDGVFAQSDKPGFSAI